MKDRYFYSLAIIAMIAIFFLALIPGEHYREPSRAEIIAQGYLISTDNLTALASAPNMNVNFHKGQNLAVHYAILSTTVPREMSQPSAGIFASLTPAYESAFAGQKLRITIVARAGRQNPLDHFQAAYFADTASSGWQSFKLTDSFTAYTFTYDRPASEQTKSNEFLGIWPGDKGGSETMELKLMRIEIME